MLNPKPQPPGYPAARADATRVLLVLLVGLLNGCLGGISGDLDARGEEPGPDPGVTAPQAECSMASCAMELTHSACEKAAACSQGEYFQCVSRGDRHYAESSRTPECKLAFMDLLRCQAASEWMCDDQGQPHAAACAGFEATWLQSCPPTSDAGAAHPLRSNAVP